MDVECTSLPGIGTCRAFTTAAGFRVGVITHYAGGRRELVHGTGDDPDASCSLALTRAEAIALAGLLGILDVIDVDITGDRKPPSVVSPH
ncbi:potassium transporter TrkA [Micromonosporaceae bacterium Da 78-11]